MAPSYKNHVLLSFQTHDEKVKKKIAQSSSSIGGGVGPPPLSGYLVLLVVWLWKDTIDNVLEYDDWVRNDF